MTNREDLDAGICHEGNSVSVSWLTRFDKRGLVYGILQPLYGGFGSVLTSPGASISRPERYLAAVFFARMANLARFGCRHPLPLVIGIAPNFRRQSLATHFPGLS
jgi:hypothetical protein